MEQDHADREQKQISVLCKIDQPLEVEGMVVLGSIARTNVLDLVGSNWCSANKAGMHKIAEAMKIVLIDT
jgi:hypothetical protein